MKNARNMWPCECVKNVVEYEDDSNTNHSWCTSNNPQESKKENGRTRNLRRNWNYPDHSSAKIGKNI